MMMMAMTQISFEELGVHAVAEASSCEHPREATVIEQVRVKPKCRGIAPWQVRCIQGHIAPQLLVPQDRGRALGAMERHVGEL
jgi:hypothetical protein